VRKSKGPPLCTSNSTPATRYGNLLHEKPW
jgi:hypothetical protein